MGVLQIHESPLTPQRENLGTADSGGSHFVDSPAICSTDLQPTGFLLLHTLPLDDPITMNKIRVNISCKLKVTLIAVTYDPDATYLGHLK